MKKLLAVLILVLAAAASAHAQDLITTKDGRLIRAKVSEVTPEIIKYKNAANPDGPLYSLNRSDVKTILYENGMVDNFDSPKAGSVPVTSYISPEARANADAVSKPEVKSPAEAMPEARPATEEEIEAASKPEVKSPAEALPEAKPAEPAVADEYDAPWDSHEVPFHFDVNYDDIKYDYDTRYYRHQSGDPFSPALAGIASMCIPGLGQCIDGEWARGIAFFFGQSAIAFVGTGLLFTPLATYDVLGDGTNSFGFFRSAAPIMLGTLGAEVLLSIWSICDAAHIAKVKNMYYQDYDRFSSTVNFKLEPSFAFTPTATGAYGPAAGVSLKLTF